MKILGIVMEANPLHNGHKYFLEEAKKQTNPDLVIAVTSTNFSMRGDVSVIDKFTKTKLLLSLGIDLVLELPFSSTNCSADYFSFNAINTLAQFNITDLAFGAECDSLNELKELQKLQKALDNSSFVKENLKKGYSYSTSTFKAIKEMTSDETLINNFSLPNNTLALHYLNALEKLNKDVNITLIKRIENNYYDELATNSISSATSLRLKLERGEDISSFVPFIVDFKNPIVLENNLYKLFQYKVASTKTSDLSLYQGVNEGIENRLSSFINLDNYEDFVKNVETKRYTKAYIKRIILNILLENYKEEQLYNYLRILGMNEKGKAYLKKLDKETKAMLITSPKDCINKLLQKEMLATKIYGIISSNASVYLDEYKLPIIKGENDA